MGTERRLRWFEENCGPPAEHRSLICIIFESISPVAFVALATYNSHIKLRSSVSFVGIVRIFYFFAFHFAANETMKPIKWCVFIHWVCDLRANVVELEKPFYLSIHARCTHTNADTRKHWSYGIRHYLVGRDNNNLRGVFSLKRNYCQMEIDNSWKKKKKSKGNNLQITGSRLCCWELWGADWWWFISITVHPPLVLGVFQWNVSADRCWRKRYATSQFALKNLSKHDSKHRE